MGVYFCRHYLLEFPVLAASRQASDDLSHTALCALMRVARQALHVWLQHRQKGITEVTEQNIEAEEERGEGRAEEYRERERSQSERGEEKCRVDRRKRWKKGEEREGRRKKRNPHQFLVGFSGV